MTDASVLPKIDSWDLNDFATPPDISGVWQRVKRQMYERNPGDGKLKGVVDVYPPDPKADGGGMVMKIFQTDKTYTSGDVNRAAHEHTTRGYYIGNQRFAYIAERIADVDASSMRLNGVATLLANDRLQTAVVGIEGGDSAPHRRRDPPNGFFEVSEWVRVTL